MTAPRPKTLTRALVGLLSLGLVAAPVLVTEAGYAAKKKNRSNDPKFRKVSPPNVFYPVTGTKAVKDQRTYSKRRLGTDIKAACNATVYASHPGIAQVATTKGKYVVRVASGRNALLTQYAFLTKALVTHGQIIQTGQAVGTLGANPSTRKCELFFSVTGRGKHVNPTSWLNAMVGNTPPVSGLFDMSAIDLASFNVLGASHTRSSSRYSTYPSRMVRAVSLLDSRGLDVVGTQEFQEVQYDYFAAKGYTKTWGECYWDPAGKRRDTENAIIFRKSTMELLGCSTYDIPYFNGNIRHVPIAHLRHKASGRTAYFLNVHNPANVRGNAAGWRAKGIQIERNKIIELRRTGRPVFITGDFNDRQNAFCPMTAGKLTISPNSIPSMTCAYPKQSTIDWIFAAGQTRFSYYLRDTSPQKAKISDHPIVIARAHLQD